MRGSDSSPANPLKAPAIALAAAAVVASTATPTRHTPRRGVRHRHHKAIASIPVGAYPHGARPGPDGRWVYVADMNGGTVSVISTATNKRVATIRGRFRSASRPMVATCTSR